jgi:hypothetical protein
VKQKIVREAFEERKKKEKRKKPQLNLSPEMIVVKDFYWWAKFENIEITIEQAASQCKLNPDIVEEWFDDPSIEKWFNTPPIRFKEALKLARYSALKKVNEIMTSGEQPNQLKAACYLIDQTGKAREKALIDDEDIDDDDGLEEDLDKMDKLMEKFNGTDRNSEVEEKE